MAFIIKPLVTREMRKITDKSSVEKLINGKRRNTYQKAETKYGFIVRQANKLEIKNEIESLYNVTVIMNTVRFMRANVLAVTLRLDSWRVRGNAFKRQSSHSERGDSMILQQYLNKKWRYVKLKPVTPGQRPKVIGTFDSHVSVPEKSRLR